MNKLAGIYFEAAREHMLFARRFRKLGDTVFEKMSLEWVRQDHNLARKILREGRKA